MAAGLSVGSTDLNGVKSYDLSSAGKPLPAWQRAQPAAKRSRRSSSPSACASASTRPRRGEEEN